MSEQPESYTEAEKRTAVEVGLPVELVRMFLDVYCQHVAGVALENKRRGEVAREKFYTGTPKVDTPVLDERFS